MEQKKINPLHIEKLKDVVNQSPYSVLLNMKLVDLGPGFSIIEMDIEPKHLNPFGSVHGGCYASLIDSAAYWAAYCNKDEDSGFTSLDLEVTNLAMAYSGKLIATATAIKEGRSIVLCEVTMTDETGKIIAYGTSKLLSLHGRQSVSDILKSMDCEPLPVKFI
ncbi:MAG: PaaI family thioesterase [Clostridia bacterium]|nr:PaaI family thioesterase [Clostridia bacterium]